MPFKTIVPPVFVQDVAVFYIVDSAQKGYLYFYKWNTISNFFELKSTQQASAGTVAAGWENETSLIRALDGVIFKENALATIKYYKTLDYSYTSSVVTLDWGTCTTGTNNGNALILR